MIVYQNDLDSEFAGIACYFVSIAHARSGESANDLNHAFRMCKKLKYIDGSNCIANPGRVARILNTGLTFIGKFYTDYIPKPGDYIIGCWKLTKETDDAHFVVMDSSGVYDRSHVAFDPWKGGSKTVREGLCTSLRVFRRSV